MEQPSATTSPPQPATTPQAPPEHPRVEAPPAGEPPAGATGFAARGRMRRRARFLRKTRELAYRDLGGLVFNLHRFGQRNDDLVLAKLSTLEQIDRELRALEHSLQERAAVTVLREAGVTACPRCAAIHSSQDRYCPSCGLSVSRHTDLPISGPAGGVEASPAAPDADRSASTSAPSPAPSSASAPVRAGASPAATAASSPPVPPASAPPVPPSQPGNAPASSPAGGTHAGAPAPDFTAQRSAGSQSPPTPEAGRRAQADDQPTRIIHPPAGGA